MISYKVKRYYSFFLDDHIVIYFDFEQQLRLSVAGILSILNKNVVRILACSFLCGDFVLDSAEISNTNSVTNSLLQPLKSVVMQVSHHQLGPSKRETLQREGKGLPRRGGFINLRLSLCGHYIRHTYEGVRA